MYQLCTRYYSHASKASIPFSRPMPLSFIPPLYDGVRHYYSRASIHPPRRAWVIPMMSIDPH